MTILTAIQAIQDLMIVIPGVNSAPHHPGPGVFPEVLCHLGSGNITPGNPAGSRLELHNIVVEVHVAEGGGLADAFKTLETLHPLIVAALCADVTFGGTLQTYADISYTTIRSEWATVQTLARIFTLNNAKIIA